MADLALIHVAHQGVHQLNQSEYRRLAIGTQLVCPNTEITSLHQSLVNSIKSIRGSFQLHL